jgi:hypothetical protein
MFFHDLISAIQHKLREWKRRQWRKQRIKQINLPF